MGGGLFGSNMGANLSPDLAQIRDLLRKLISSAGGGTILINFTSLADTPSSYASQGGKALRVNAGESGIEFYASDSIVWSEITGATTASANCGYVTNDVSQIVVTLPATADAFTIISIEGKGSGGWKLAQNAGQQIHQLGASTTSGVGGYVESNEDLAGITVMCITANTTWKVIAVNGNITLV